MPTAALRPRNHLRGQRPFLTVLSFPSTFAPGGETRRSSSLGEDEEQPPTAAYRSTSPSRRKSCSRTILVICDDFPVFHRQAAP